MKRGLFLGSLLLLLTAPAGALTIDKDTTWRGSLTLNEVVRVEAGVTLTIAPGARITFTGGKLEIAGRLIAEQADFSGSGWEGIILKGCDERTSIKGGRVTGAKTGIFSGGGAPRIDGVTLMDNEVGIELKQKSSARITACRFINNRKVGLFIKDESTPIVTDNLFETHPRFGVYIYRSQPTRFAGNRLAKNDTGLIITHVGSDPLIEENRFEENTLGVLVDRAARPLLRNNLIKGNRTGVRLYRRADARLTGNRLEKNDAAISIAFSSYPQIEANDFIGNRRALVLEFQSSAWEQQKGEAARAAETENRSGAFGQGAGHAETAEARRRPEALTGLVDARNNWWGPDGTAELARIGAEGNPSFITDGRDTPTFVESNQTWPLDRVSLAPWRTTPVAAWPEGR